MALLVSIGEGLVLDWRQTALGLLIGAQRLDSIDRQGQPEPLTTFSGLAQGLVVRIQEIDTPLCAGSLTPEKGPGTGVRSPGDSGYRDSTSADRSGYRRSARVPRSH